MKCGVYIIVNRISSNYYIGSSVDMNDRWYRHKRALKNNNHCNFKLQRAYVKHGIDALEFRVLEYCDENIVREREQYYIDYSQQGERNSIAKLTDQQVLQILAHIHDGMTGIAVAKLFQISPSTVSQIKNGQRGRHI